MNSESWISALTPRLRFYDPREATEARIGWSTKTRREGNGTALDVSCRNDGDRPTKLRQAVLEFALPRDPSSLALRIAYCGAHSGSVQSRSDVRAIGDEPVESWWVGARCGATGAIVLGALDCTRWLTAIHAGAASIAATHWLEGVVLQPGESLSLPCLWAATRASGAPLPELEEFATIFGARHGVGELSSPCGWGSWGEYAERIDEGLVREAMLALDGTPHFRECIGVIQIDDGWAQLLDNAKVAPTWQPNGRFAWGIAPLAARLAGAERVAGLWILPFTANEGSPTIADHPDLLVRNGEGEPLRVGGGSSFVFDPTRTAAAMELKRRFQRIADWGVGYLKLDFLRALLCADPTTGADDLDATRVYADGGTRVQAYRAGLALVREVFGPDVFVLGCSSPLGAGVGLLDAQRVGPDVEPTWVGRRAGIRDCARAVAANWFWNGRAWTNDPDYLITGPSLDESRFWALVVALSGGSAILSVDLEQIEPWREDLLAFVTPSSGRSARPLDLFESMGEPTTWHLPCRVQGDEWSTIGLFNWSDQPRDISVSLERFQLSEAHVWDPWRGEYSYVRGHIRANLRAHDARLLAVRAPSSRPVVVGSSIHFTQGERELTSVEWCEPTLVLNPGSRFREGTLTIWSPRDWQPPDVGEVQQRTDGWLLTMPWTTRTGEAVLRFTLIR
jgi:alpha-galactosidase